MDEATREREKERTTARAREMEHGTRTRHKMVFNWANFTSALTWTQSKSLIFHNMRTLFVYGHIPTWIIVSFTAIIKTRCTHLMMTTMTTTAIAAREEREKKKWLNVFAFRSSIHWNFNRTIAILPVPVEIVSSFSHWLSHCRTRKQFIWLTFYHSFTLVCFDRRFQILVHPATVQRLF